MKIRSVHPRFFNDPQLARISPHARLLYIGLWCYADDEGRGDWLPKQIDGDLFPHEPVRILDLLDELKRIGKVECYSVGGRDYFWMPAFSRWQNPKYKRDSKIPPPPSGVGPGLSPILRQLGEDSGTAFPNPVQREGEGEGEGDGVGEGDTHTPAKRLAEVWGCPTSAAAGVCDSLTGIELLTDHQLRNLVAQAKAEGTRTVQGLPHVWGSLVPKQSKQIPWCGVCEESSRMVSTDDGDVPCSECHPRSRR